MAVDLRKVKKLIELVEESAISELEVANGDESVRIVMHRGVAPSVVTAAAASSNAVAPENAVTPENAATSTVESGGSPTRSIAAPMAGTFYRAPHPDAAPFVEQGQSVEAGDVVCIIESMKMMHEIRAAEAGVIAQICVDNGQPIGTGEALFKLS